MNRDFSSGMIVGWVATMLLVTAPFSDASKYREAIKECQKTLPRDQHCKVIGVPE